MLLRRVFVTQISIELFSPPKQVLHRVRIVLFD